MHRISSPKPSTAKTPWPAARAKPLLLLPRAGDTAQPVSAAHLPFHDSPDSYCTTQKLLHRRRDRRGQATSRAVCSIAPTTCCRVSTAWRRKRCCTRCPTSRLCSRTSRSLFGSAASTRRAPRPVGRTLSVHAKGGNSITHPSLGNVPRYFETFPGVQSRVRAQYSFGMSARAVAVAADPAPQGLDRALGNSALRATDGRCSTWRPSPTPRSVARTPRSSRSSYAASRTLSQARPEQNPRLALCGAYS